MITNYPEFFCAVAKSYDTSTTRYYSNVDPSREWTGTPSIEFAEDEPDVQWFISGKFQKTHKLVAYSRATTEAQALQLVKDLLPLVLNQTMEQLKGANEIFYYTIDDLGTTADVRGYAVGETFYGYVNFSVTEKINLP